MTTVRPILCCSIPLHINIIATTFFVVIKLAEVTKVVTKDLMIFRQFGHHLLTWSHVPLLHVWPLQIFQRPICSHHEYVLVRILGRHSVLALPTNDIGNCIHVSNLILLHVTNNLLCRHPLWPVASFLNQRRPKYALFKYQDEPPQNKEAAVHNDQLTRYP